MELDLTKLDDLLGLHEKLRDFLNFNFKMFENNNLGKEKQEQFDTLQKSASVILAEINTAIYNEMVSQANKITIKDSIEEN